MAQIEKTIFISYRRKDISWALLVYDSLTSQRNKYDVFFDFTSIPSGDFEQVIVSNIKARAHFILILTPTALDRCDEPGDWLRQEIEIAMDEKRNIIPLFFDGFRFGLPNVAGKLTGKLSTLKRYNGLDVPAIYFKEAMSRLRRQYLRIPLDAVLLPVPDEVKNIVKKEQEAAKKVLAQKSEPLLFYPIAELSLRSKPVVSPDTVIRRIPTTEKLISIEPTDVVLPKIGIVNEWLNVRDIENNEGFVAAWYVKYENADAKQQTVTSATTENPLKVKATAEGVALRKQPVISNSTLLKRLPLGTEFTVTEANASSKIGKKDQWLKVKDPTGTEGYVAAWFVKFS